VEEVEKALPDSDDDWAEEPKKGKGIRKGKSGGGHANNVGGAATASPKVSAKKGGKGGKGK
jgi:hypothetical protein